VDGLLGLARLVQRVRHSIDLNNIAKHQFAPPSGFHFTVDLNLTILDQKLRLSTRIRNATEFQELIQPQGFTFRIGIG
jgi:hypothetical protein